MHILMTGATGLIGRELGKALAARGDTLSCLVRDPLAARRKLPYPAHCHAWRHDQPVPAQAMAGVDAVVHLAGEPVADQRWTPQRKALIRDSRVLGTRALVQAVLDQGGRVRAFVHGSATGWWGDRGDEKVWAHSIKGGGFLSDLTAAWEAELQVLRAQRPDLRVPVVRTGVVLAREGGALAEMLPLFRLSAGGRLGGGAQWMPWIHLHDIVALFLHALDQPVSGVLEGVAPQPASNRQFTAALCKALGVRENLPVPSLAIQALWGERADIVLGGARVEPVATQATGFRWHFESVDAALQDLLAPLQGGVWQRVWEQWLPHPAEAIWPFFCSAHNLEAITPPFLQFQVLGMDTEEIGAGSLIDYRLRLAGVPLRWRTRIESWQPLQRFVDTQERGPYRLWHHTHDFESLAGGTLMRDTVRWQLPVGWLGSAAGGAAVEAAVQRIFAYRALKIDERFGGPSD